MITTGILYLIYFFITAVLSPLLLFDDVTIPTSITSSISSASSYLHILDTVIPIDSLIAIISIVVIIETGIFTYKLIRWVYQKIPGVN